jgi:hypothetical protein
MTDPVSTFWSLFRQRANELALVGSTERTVYDELLACLHGIDPGLYLEFCVDTVPCELIVTAEGNRELFPLARAVVAAAPPLETWTVRALKPKLGFPKTVRWEGLTLTVATIVFEPLEREGSADLGLRLLVPGIDASQLDNAHNALLRALDHGLGEERHAESIQFSEVRALGLDADTSAFIPLTDLDRFIEWRSARLSNHGGRF